MTKLKKNSNCDKTQSEEKTQKLKMCQNSNGDKNWEVKWWKSSKNSKCDKTLAMFHLKTL